MKTLHLNVKKKWFEMIASAEKKEEYREITPYWEKRLYHVCYPRILQFRDYDIVEFRNGYSANAKKIRLVCDGITGGIGNYYWGAPNRPVFIIKLGKILKDTI